MVFGLFSRKTQPQIPAQEVAPEIPTASGSSRTIEQLRTPSPSVDSASVGKPPYSPRTALDASPEHYAPPITPSPPPEEDLVLITDPTALHDLIRSVPHKTFQEYVLDHLKPSSHSQPSHLPCEPPSPRTLTHLTSFFSALTPPPRLHCVRCHKDYYDVENDDRSCFVPHDDDSAEVERLSVAEKRVMNADFETLYGCCGSSVAGDGDMGPPDGWCYEGKHTTDLKRARFRADSTLHDDKLTSCARLRCHDPPPSPGSDGSSVSSTISRPRKRKRSTTRASGVFRMVESQPQEEEEEEEEDGQEDVHMGGQDDDVRSATSSRGKRKVSTTKPPRKKKARTSPEPEQPEQLDTPPTDVEMDDAASVASLKSTTSKRSTKSATKSKPKPKSKTAKPVSKSTTTPNSKPAPKAARKTTANMAEVALTSRSSQSPSRNVFPSTSTPPPPPSLHSTPASPSGKARGSTHKKSTVSFSSMTTTFPAFDPAGGSGSVQGVKGAMKTKGEASKRKSKPLTEVVSSSVDGEGW